MRRTLTVLGTFLAMEPATYAAHRWVMHGAGWALHRSHHRATAAALEANDAFPAIFSSATILAMAAGRRASRPDVQTIGAGVTLYGLAYGLVHDVYIHARLGALPRVAALERLKDAHRLHHLFGAEPYGMLFPIVPEAVRARGAERGWDGPWEGRGDGLPSATATDTLARGRSRGRRSRRLGARRG